MAGPSDASKSDAIVIRQADFSESSRVVTFFTREDGKIGMLAKGGRRRRNPFDDALDLLAESSIVYLRKSSGRLSLLTEGRLKQRFRPPADNLRSLYVGYYVAELLDGLTEEEDPHPELYDEAVLALGRFATGDKDEVDRALLRFELRLLREIGHLPSFDECLRCGRSTAQGARGAAGHYVHWVSAGGVLCADCRNADYDTKRLEPGTIAVMRHLADAPDERLGRVAVERSQLNQLRNVLNSAILYVLERKPKMLRYL